MLITFTCDAYENITMFGGVAKKMLNLMGNSGAVPGAILADDVPAALARLQAGLAQEKPQVPVKPTEDDDHEPDVSLVHRAVPLVALLNAAVKAKCNVMWE